MSAAKERAEAIERRVVDKQASNDLSMVIQMMPKLLEAKSFASWINQLERAAFQCRWSKDVLDLDMNGEELPEEMSLKQTADTRVAYSAMITLCAGHDVMDELESVEVGAAREVYKVLYQWHYHPTESG